MSEGQDLHVVVYRTGGYASFTWRRVLNRLRLDAARRTAEEMRDMGYRALVLTAAEFEAKGLPQTWEADEYIAPGVVVEMRYLEMAIQLEENMRPGQSYSLTDCCAILFGTARQRDTCGLGSCGKRWTGFNRGEQAAIIEDLVQEGLLAFSVSNRGTRYGRL